MKTWQSQAAVVAAVVVLAGLSSAGAQTFSLDGPSPSLIPPGTNADDLFGPAFPAIFVTGAPGAGFEVDAFSFQQPGIPGSVADIASVEFSVDLAALGIPGTAVAVETGGGGPGMAAADVFQTSAPFGFPGGNVQIYDGDGIPTAPNAAPGLGLFEGAAGDNLDGLDLTGLALAVYWSVDPATAAIYGGGATAADIFIGPAAAGYSGIPGFYAPGVALGLNGLGPGDDIDALVVFDNGNFTYDPATDVILFSLAPGSPTLAAIAGPGGAATAGDILLDAAASGGLLPTIVMPAESLGLQTIRSGFFAQDDNLDALSVTLIPEPGMWAALGALLALAPFVRRFRRK